MMSLCVECKKREVHVKKWHLCRQCYQVFRRSGKLARISYWAEKEIYDPEFRPDKPYLGKDSYRKATKREFDFVRNFFNHNNWVWHPCVFHIPTVDAKYENYSPDFYDSQRSIFIEVSATRQAYYQNRKKYARFRAAFNGLPLEVRAIDGSIIEDTDGAISEEFSIERSFPI